MNLNQIGRRVHERAVKSGFYSFEEDERHFLARFCSNLHAEVSELWEAFRNKQLREPCGKEALVNGRPLTCLEEEMADIIIRTLDACSHLGVDIDGAVAAKMEHNATRPFRHGGKAA